MSPTTRGPLSPAVYWRRRAFVIGVVVALVVLSAALLRGGDDGGPARATQSSATTGQSPAPGEDASSAPGGDSSSGPAQEGKGSKGKGRGKGNGSGKNAQDEPVEPVEPVEPEPAEPVGTCADADVLVTPVVLLANAGEPVAINLRLHTNKTEACTWELSSQHLALKITDADGEVVWTSVDCPGQVPTESVVVRRDSLSVVRINWNGRYSGIGCPIPRQSRFAEPGPYLVAAAAFGSDPDQTSFELGDVTPEIVTEPPAKNKGKGKGKKAD